MNSKVFKVFRNHVTMNIQKRFHLNRDTGEVSQCHADKKECPFGEQNHFATQAEGRQSYENEMENSEIQKPSRISKDFPSDKARELSLKLEIHFRKNRLDPKEIRAAVDLGIVLHDKQFRRELSDETGGKTPYIEHPLRAANFLAEIGVKDKSVLQAAVLHDTVEDGSKQYMRVFKNESRKNFNEVKARIELDNYLQNQFGERTASLVLSVTNPTRTREQSIVMTDQEKIDTYKNNLSKKINSDPGTALVKFSDFNDNAGSIHNSVDPGKEKKVLFSSKKYAACVNEFKKVFSNPNPYISEEISKKILRKLNTIERGLLMTIERCESNIKRREKEENPQSWIY